MASRGVCANRPQLVASLWLNRHGAHVTTPAWPGLQTVVTRLLTAAPGDGTERVVAGVVALHGRHCLWSSLPRDDSAAVYCFAAAALVPLLKKPPSALRVLARTARARCVAELLPCCRILL